jgi:RHS repeat-associated protein
VERLSYDAWGKRRNANGTDDLTIALVSAITDHGYTGHEHLNDMGLIHMNGRVYDPRTGRFLQADPTIQSPGNLQSFNRYTYVMNNPFFYTDPSGFSFFTDLRDAAVIIVIAYYCGPECVAAYVGTDTYIKTGSLEQGLKAAIINYATSQAFDAVGGNPATADGMGNVVGHAVVGCLSAAASQGDCKSGALAAAAGSAWSQYGPTFETKEANLVMHSLVGGVTSVLGGGKFENGATTAAFGYLFNDLMHENTASANGLHRRLVVRDDTGKALFGFSFFMTDNSDPFTDNFSKGSSSGVPRPGGKGNGEVLIDMVLPTTNTANVFRTTATEDQLMVNYMKSRVGQTAPYNALTNSCRDFSAAQFDYMKTEILRARSEGRDSKF